MADGLRTEGLTPGPACENDGPRTTKICQVENYALCELSKCDASKISRCFLTFIFSKRLGSTVRVRNIVVAVHALLNQCSTYCSFFPYIYLVASVFGGRFISGTNFLAFSAATIDTSRYLQHRDFDATATVIPSYRLATR